MAAGGSPVCNAVYLVASSFANAPLRLTGSLTELPDGVSGGGAYQAGVDPPFDIYVTGAWSATRLQAAPAAAAATASNLSDLAAPLATNGSGP